jgi:hypothetical protein
MKHKSFHLILITIGLALLRVRSIEGGGTEFTPDAIIEAQIHYIASATNATDYASRVQDLTNQADGRKEEFARQAIWFSAKVATNDRDAFVGTTLVLQLGITNRVDILNTIRPLLWARDGNLERVLYDFLYEVENRVKGEEPDFDRFMPIFQGSKTNPPEVLVQYMFSRSPSKALKVLSDIYVEDAEQREQIMDADRILNNYLHLQRDTSTEQRAKAKQEAQEAMAFLSQRSEWPVKRYLEAMKGHPELRS